MTPIILTYLLLAIILGLVLVLFLLQRTRRALEHDLASEREERAKLLTANERIPSLDAELKRLNDDVIRPLESDRARLSEKAERIPQLEKTIEAREKTLESAQREINDLRGAKERLTAELDAERTNFQRLNDAREELLNQFEAISKRVLSTSNNSFLTLAEQKLGTYQEAAKGDLEKRQQAIVELLKPLEKTLGALDENNREMERLRIDAYATLVQQVQHLHQSDELSRQEVTKLISTLDAPKPRGDWGEEQLRRIVELAGMTEYCNFDVQVHLKGDSSFRADMIVHLAGGKSIIVDAKAPWDREVFQSEDSKERQSKVFVMCSNFRKHIDDLRKRDYSSLVQGSPDFVVMFVPIEPVFHLVLQTDPSLIAYAISQKVVLASPTTLIAMLKSVAYGWQQDAISRNAQEIRKLGKELYDRFGVFGKHLSSVGKHLNDSVKSYNELLNSTESRLLVSARRFNKEFKISSDSDISESRPVETIAAFASAPELQQESLPVAEQMESIIERTKLE